MICQKVPFRKIPGLSRIFLEYLDQAPGALGFYQRLPTLESLESYCRDELLRSIFPRREIAAILRRQNALLDAGARTAGNIDELEKPDCVAIVTGQQVGLFTGPLYTIYKALTTIHMAEELNARGLRTVPLFWMECEDHDLAEVTHGTVLKADSSLRGFDFKEQLFGDTQEFAIPVGTRYFPESIRQAVSEFLSFLPEGMHKEQCRATLEAACAPGIRFDLAFGRLMADLFRQHGLIFFNPTDPEAKHLAAPIFRKAVNDAGEIRDSLLERSRALEAAGFHSQVSVHNHSTVLFLQEDDKRRALIQREGAFSLKNSHDMITAQELLVLCGTAPKRFSPSVLLRPIVQDHLFPTAAYVGGPAEIAYFAQVEVLYRHFGRSMPVIWPRSSFTLIEKEVAAAMEQAGVEFEDCLEGNARVAEKLIGAAQRLGAGMQLNALGGEIERTLQDIRPSMISADTSLGSVLETARRKILHHIGILQARFIQMEAHRDTAIAKNVETILNHCCPNQTLQERTLGIHSFLARNGRGLLDIIKGMVDLQHFVHKLIILN